MPWSYVVCTPARHTKAKRAPTADEIADAIRKKEKQDVQPIQQTLGAAQQTVVAANEPKPKRQGQKKQVPKQQSQQSEQSESSQPANTPPQLAKLGILLKPQVSTRVDAPYKTEAIVTTTMDFPSLKLVIQCDKPLVDGSGGLQSGGMLIMTSQGVVRDHPNAFIFTYGSATPQFGPATPLVFNLWSKGSVKCGVATF